jgi:RNA polymerase sigma factor (sigma-70 family)
MTTTLQSGKNFNLSASDFEALLDAMCEGNELLFEKAFLSHFEYCMNILKKKYSASHEDAYDITMWGMLEFRKLLIARRISYGNLQTYLIRMISNRYLYIKKRPMHASLEDWMDNKVREVPPETDEDDLHLLGQAWQRLCDDCRTLLQLYYYDKLQLKEISKLTNDSSEANTRKRKERCVKKLRDIFFSK